MKIVLSRKGFDKGSGGAASPIFEDGTMLSLPIPDGRRGRRYGELKYGNIDVGSMVSDLTDNRYRALSYAHADPDLDAGRFDSRPAGWKPAFGQTMAAQTHLDNNGVGPGDLFLFFGWFADVEQTANGSWRRRRGGRDMHAIHGWMQVGEILRLPRGDEWHHYPWLAQHPHVGRGAEAGNTIYIASDHLVMPDDRPTPFSGGGSLARIESINTLTAPGQPLKSLWQLPQFFSPSEGRPLSYHGDAARWSTGEGCVNLKTVGRGQEFVINVDTDQRASDWIYQMLETTI